MIVRFGVAALIAFAPVSVLAQESAAPAEALAPVRAQADDDKREQARIILEGLRLREIFMSTLTPLLEASGNEMLAELEMSEDGRALLVSIDAKFPEGRTGFAQRFSEHLRAKFDAAFPQFLDRHVDLLTDQLSAADLAAFREAVALPDGTARTGTDAEEARQRFRRTPAAARMMTIVPQIQQEMTRFGEELGSRLGTETYNEIAAQHPAVFGDAS